MSLVLNIYDFLVQSAAKLRVNTRLLPLAMLPTGSPAGSSSF